MRCPHCGGYNLVGIPLTPTTGETMNWTNPLARPTHYRCQNCKGCFRLTSKWDIKG